MSNTASKLQGAKARLAAVQQEIERLENRASWEANFIQGDIHLLIRHNIDNGKIEGIEAASLDSHVLTEFASGLPAYGIGKDLHIKTVPLLSLTGER
jgi:hypothetical protein